MLIYLASIGTESEKSKFVQLYEAYQGLMFHTAFRLLRQPEDAGGCGPRGVFVPCGKYFENFGAGVAKNQGLRRFNC